LSHPNYQQKNLELCIKVLINNGYPLSLIFVTINKRLKKLFSNKLDNKEIVPIKNNQVDTNIKKFFIILYIRNISEITTSLINKSVFIVGFRSLNKIDKYVRVQKDQTEHTEK